MKDLLQGKPLRHPLHPLLVHFPLGFFFFSLILDLVSHVMPWLGPLVRGAFYLMLLGIITALIAAIPGFVDYSDLRKDRPGKRAATAHMILNLVAVALYGVNAGFRVSQLDEAITPAAALILSLIGAALLTASGYLGGHMVYDEGIAVGRHRRRAAAPEQTLRFSSADFATKDPDSHSVAVPTVSEQRLREQETLRIEIDRQVLVLAKLGGKHYAFQEFCTHRFGPLSEGSFQGLEVQCPWHSSCFNVATGKVTKGPAKTELKTFPTEVREGKVYVLIEHPQAERSAQLNAYKP